ncbi:hypothetical protein [Baaleninema simplex]|uniref:hypothetical protein n=1 Tax=Baaleninema simplex TaxID=2862350 RepID=UPI000347702E|nr:hypothetical protein [Baaleninema simplex]
MSFNSYKNIESVLNDFSLTYTEDNFIQNLSFEAEPFFLSRLQTTLQDGVVFNSEYAICENIISPILKEIWIKYKDRLQLWSHQPLIYNETLSGIPDYIVAQRSPRGKIILGQPYLILVEAKKDNFDEGWGQCLAELVAAQKLNDNLSCQIIFGIVSNGKLWEFGKLQGEVFTKNIRFYTLEELNHLMSAINYVFSESVKLVS